MNPRELDLIRSAQFSDTLVNYLLSLGWVVIETPKKWTDIAILRKFFDGQEEEIVVPKDLNFADYDYRIEDAMDYIALYEKLPIEKVKSDLLTLH